MILIGLLSVGVNFLEGCVWNNLGGPPQATEIEVTVIGPGYGESVVVHLGNGEWLIVDSCVDITESKSSAAPLRYLRQLGVQVQHSVKFVVVSHWHDDHIKGIGEVVEACPSARFICSKIFCQEKFTAFVEAMSIGSTATNGAAVKNLRKVLRILHDRGQSITRAVPGRKLYSSPAIHSWSPSDYDDDQFLQYITQTYPRAGEPLRRAVLGTENITSVVLSFDWPASSVLLCADMEVSSDNRRGWGAIFSTVGDVGGWKRGDLVKIPHHGSHTGHDDRMWDDLLCGTPISVVTPFGKGPIKSRPPKAEDIRRISQRSGSMFLTAGHSAPKPSKKDQAVIRSLREGAISLTSQRAPIGMVRHRRAVGGQWKHELFGEARRTK